MKNAIKTIAVAAIFSVAALSTPASAAVNLIDQTYGVGAGSFELGSFTPIGTGNFVFQSLTPGMTNITGWSVGGVGVDWLSTPFYGANNGIHAIDLGYNGVGNNFGPGTISTSISTTVGASYLLTFAATAVSGFSTYTNTGLVTAGSLNQAFTVPFTPIANDFANQVYTNYSYTFTATSATTTVTFGATNPNTVYGPVIDNVSVSAVSGAVPEPATWAMMMAGFAVAGFAMRKQKKAVRIAYSIA